MIIKKEKIQNLAYENLREMQIPKVIKKYEKYTKKINKGIEKAARKGCLSYIKKVAPWEEKMIYDEIIFDLRKAGYKVDIRNNYKDLYAILQGTTEEIVVYWKDIDIEIEKLKINDEHWLDDFYKIN